MTVILCDAETGVMMGDTLITSDGNKCATAHAVKIVRGADGSLYGAAGEVAAGWEFLNWATTSGRGSPPAKIWEMDACLEGIRLRTDQVIEWYNCPTPDVLYERRFAIGYGAREATAALAAGASLMEAMQVACALTTCCGEPITTLELANTTVVR